MLKSPRPATPAGLLRKALCLLLTLIALSGTAPVVAQDNPSGLPLPRFATTRSTPINVRVGPGTRYDIVWVYQQAGVPVEIIQEFDTWRKIRDVDGEVGWVHQNLLSGDRAGYAAPWNPEARVPIMPGKSEEGQPRAILGAGFRVAIAECDGTWCEVSATSHPEDGRPATYTGYVKQVDLWGVYKQEVFD